MHRNRAGAAAGAGVLTLLIGLQIVASHMGIRGPLHSLANDWFGTPQSATLPWVGLGLTLVGLPRRRRLIAIGAAIGIDMLFAAERVARGGVLAVGNGPMIVIAGIVALALLRWIGTERDDALHSAGWGLLVIVASKIGDTWLSITATSRPGVLDDYAMLADHALGQPSWLLGTAVQAAGPIPFAVLHWVYIELPVAMMAVAVWQLRDVHAGGWPRHHLMRTFILLGLLGPLIYLLFPVVGPVFAFGPQGHGWQVADVWPHLRTSANFQPHVIAFDSVTPRNCMPSMHIGWTLAVFIHSRGGPNWLRWGGAAWLASTVIATLGFGYHYGVDLVAGAVLCLTVESALRDPQRGWDPSRILLVGGGATFLATLLLCYRYLAEPMAHAPLYFGLLIIGSLLAFAVRFSQVFFPRPAPADSMLPVFHADSPVG